MTHDNLFARIRKYWHGEPVRVVLTATILRAGWEMDNEAWLVEMAGGEVLAFTTDHGSVCPEDRGDFLDYIAATRESLASLEAFLAQWPADALPGSPPPA